MTGVAYATSAEMASELGAFRDYDRNADNMLRVMCNHRRAAYGERDGYEKLAVSPVPLVAADVKQQELVTRARAAWDRAIELGFSHCSSPSTTAAATT
jgi:ribonucleoside-diphosphate reductase alpha chain